MIDVELILWWMLGIVAGFYVLSFPVEWYLNWRDRQSLYVDEEPVEDARDWQSEFHRIVSGRVK